jgi:hypothetical protein
MDRKWALGITAVLLYLAGTGLGYKAAQDRCDALCQERDQLREHVKLLQERIDELTTQVVVYESLIADREREPTTCICECIDVHQMEKHDEPPPCDCPGFVPHLGDRYRYEFDISIGPHLGEDRGAAVEFGFYRGAWGASAIFTHIDYPRLSFDPDVIFGDGTFQVPPFDSFQPDKGAAFLMMRRRFR